jgi:glyoxylase-like metal-dependent hydrolase (beta-lactamase superfamily II)
VVELAEGVGWTRSPVPGSLNHINIWLLEDDGGVAVVDTGLNIPAAREAWETLLAGPLAGRAVSRVICTHFHPDHLGMAGWLVERFGVRLWMTQANGCSRGC